MARLQAAGELDRVKAIYLTSYYDNPRAITIPADRRARLVEIAKRWSQRRQIYLIEDAAYRELRYEGDDVPSLRSFDAEGDTVIYAGTLLEIVFAGHSRGLGRAAGRAPAAGAGRKREHRFRLAAFQPGVDGRGARARACSTSTSELRVQYRAKTDAILAAAEEYLRPIGGVDWVRPGGGLYLWVTLPEGIDAGLDGPLFDRAVAEGVLYVPGQYCYPRRGPARRPQHAPPEFRRRLARPPPPRRRRPGPRPSAGGLIWRDAAQRMKGV